ncbi:MAG: inositol-3-phosphate synthase [Verrucomicrobia bacterium]|nr:inositol-3-phosphate synthase [Verrucomicrobiota bacterium]
MSRKIRTAIIGAGNCASALVQGTRFYRNVKASDDAIGLMHPSLGGYLPKDIEISAAFDIDARKVGKDLSEAIFSAPNNTRRFAEVEPLGVEVLPGQVLDGIGKYCRDVIPIYDGKPADVADVLRQTRTDVMVSYLPVGSEQAAGWYAEQCIAAGCALVNCMPVFITSNAGWQERFIAAGLPMVGDDIKSQLGATILHRALVELFRTRGVRVERTYQLNFGGNTDFLNMLERERLTSKKISKTQAVTSIMDYKLPADSIHVGPSDFVPWLEDRKFCQIRVEGKAFGDNPIMCEVKLEVWDSPNSAGVVIDAIRCAKLGLNRGDAGPLIGPCSYFMKSPPVQFPDEEARRRTEEYITRKETTPLEIPVISGNRRSGNAVRVSAK